MNICQTQWSKQTSLYSLLLTTITSTNETYTVILQPPKTRTFLNVDNTRDPSSTTNSRNMLKKVKSTACLINGQALPRTKYPNQSLDTLIFPIIPRSIWQFVAFPYIQAVRKAAKKHQNKNLSSKSAPLILTESTSAFHLTDAFLFSRHHIPTNSVAPLSAYKPTHNPQFLQSL